VLAVNTEEVPSPLASVVTEQVVAGEFDVQPVAANVPLAPALGPLKVTETPGTGFPPESLTTATSLFAKAVFTVADCPEPETTVMLLAGP
jgi:hypothetical protein